MTHEQHPDIDRLCTNPKTRLWESEIQHALLGEREYVLVTLGGLYEYIEVLIRKSIDQAIARVSMNRALDRILSQWQWSPADRYYASHLFELLAGYTPRRGAYKLVVFLSSWASANADMTSADSSEDDLVFQAFVTLTYYYKVAAPRDPVYREYVTILNNQLTLEKHVGHALGRLLMLGEVKPADARILSIATYKPMELTETFRTILEGPVRSKEAKIMADLFHSITPLDQARVVFDRALTSLGVTTKDTECGLALQFPNGETLSLPFDLDQIAAVTPASWQVNDYLGCEKLTTILNQNPGDD